MRALLAVAVVVFKTQGDRFVGVGEITMIGPVR